MVQAYTAVTTAPHGTSTAPSCFTFPVARPAEARYETVPISAHFAQISGASGVTLEWSPATLVAGLTRFATQRKVRSAAQGTGLRR